MIFENVKIGGRLVDLRTHPAADAFPMLKGAEFDALRDDIAKNGLQQRIVLNHAGDVLVDGRNRLKACLALGIDPKFDQLAEHEDELDYVVSANLARRHLNETQRAFVGAELVPMYEAQAKERMLAGVAATGVKGTAASFAAGALNVSRSSVELALSVKRNATPELLNAARGCSGGLAVSAAAEIAKLPQTEQRQILQGIESGAIQARKVRALVGQEKFRAAQKILKGEPALIEAAKDGRIALSAAAAASDLPAWRQRDIAVDPSRARRAASATKEMTEDDLIALLDKKAEDYLDIVKKLVAVRLVPSGDLRRITNEIEIAARHAKSAKAV